MFSKVLVPIDLQQPRAASALLDVASRFVRDLRCSVHVMTVIPGYSMPIVAAYFPADAKATAKREVEAKLKAFAAKAMGDAKHTTSVSEGRRADEVLKAAKKRKVDMILVGGFSHGRIQDAVLGSVGTKVAQGAPCSVMVVRG